MEPVPSRSMPIASLVFLAALAGPKGDAIVRKIDELQIPSPDLKEMQDPVKASAYRRMVGEMTLRRNGLILQLYRVDPSHPRTVPLMRERWAKFEAGDRGAPTDYIARVLTDIDRVLADRPTRMIRILGEAARINVRLENMPRGSWGGAGDAIAEFFRRYPANPEGVNVVLNWVYRSEGETKAAACRTFLTQFANHPFAPQIKGKVHLSEGVGKPFPLRFNDFVTGKPFDLEELRGKVVAVDFWATWCGPCVVKMPEMRRLREEYRAQGFEIVGVSLDAPESEGGLKSLQTFLKKTGYDWPQFYQGNAWSSEFSAGWGVMAIPELFLIDRKGILRETGVIDLESSLKKLLAEPS
ncbi:TlpA family protein disulfide reductase [bacterium]|nr:MAG: TlpA family protein disulfide reductase [bacterium]